MSKSKLWSVDPFSMGGCKTVIRSVCQTGLLNRHLCVIFAMSTFPSKFHENLFLYIERLCFIGFADLQMKKFDNLNWWFNSKLQLLWMMCKYFNLDSNDDSTVYKELELCHLDILLQDTQQRFSIKVRRVSTTWPQTQSVFCAARMSFSPHQTRTQCYPNIEAARLRTVLLKQSLWPCDYLFKLYMSCWQPYWVGPWSWQDQLFTFCTQRWNLILQPLFLHLKITLFSADFIC